MKKKIIIALADAFTNKIAKLVANDLGFYFLNLDEYIDYNIFDSERILAKCGIEYLKNQEVKYLQDALQLDDMLYYASYELFVNNQKLFNDYEKIYVALSREQLIKLKEKNFEINDLAFEDRDKFLKSIAISVESDFLIEKSFANKIVNTLKKLS